MISSKQLDILLHTPADYPEIVRLNRLVSPRLRLTAEEIEHHDSVVIKNCFLRRFIGRIDGEVVATAHCNQSAGMFHPQKFWVLVRIAPKFRRLGIGLAMYERAMNEIAEFNPITIWSRVFEDEPYAMRFAEKLGFVESMRDWESVLFPANLDLTKFDNPEQRLKSEGIQIKTLADLESDPDRDEKLHALDMDTSVDVPMPEPFTPYSLEQYRDFVLHDPSLLPNAFFVAVDGEKYVGLSVLWKQGASNSLDTGYTAVLREYRRRGIALALKLRAMQFAKENGYEKVFTQNATTNRPMLSINEMLGFEKLPAEITLIKELQPETTGDSA